MCVLLLIVSCVEVALALHPIIIIPGDGGNQLEARLNKPESGAASSPFSTPPLISSLSFASNVMKNADECPTKSDWYRLWLDVWQLGRSTALKCWADNIQIHYDAETGKSHNTPGVETRVPGWGQTDSVEYLDPSWSAWILKDVGNYFGTFVTAMVDSLGYERGKSIRAAPYDFRFAPYSQEAYFRRLKLLIEDTRSLNSGSPVILVSHSLGGLFALHFLNRMTAEWKRDNVKLFVPIGTPWAGTVVAFNIFAAGYDMGIKVIDPKIIRSEQRSYETGAQLLPHPTLWRPSDEIFLSTPRRNFTANDYDAFFEALRFPIGKINHDSSLKDMGDVGDRLPSPGVDVACVYSKGVRTMARLIYEDDARFLEGEQPSSYEYSDGDGSVNLDSLRLCHQWQLGAHLDHMNNDFSSSSSSSPSFSSSSTSVTVKVFDGIDHGATIKDTQIIEYLKTLVSSH